VSIEVNGIAHVQLSVRDMVRSVAFYEPFLHALGLETLVNSPEYFYCIGARTGLCISPVSPERAAESFDQRRVGLHHLCFRARSREDVDAIHEAGIRAGGRIVHPPREDGFAPGYYSVLLEDPDGIRIEACFVPGKGHFDPERGAIGSREAASGG
jgi:catechol 2,3-dioxygenase-like lactoylglutathione lyase family enzyme